MQSILLDCRAQCRGMSESRGRGGREGVACSLDPLLIAYPYPLSKISLIKRPCPYSLEINIMYLYFPEPVTGSRCNGLMHAAWQQIKRPICHSKKSNRSWFSYSTNKVLTISLTGWSEWHWIMIRMFPINREIATFFGNWKLAVEKVTKKSTRISRKLAPKSSLVPGVTSKKGLGNARPGYTSETPDRY